MTINKTYDTVQFWEVKNHKQYTLKGRIKKGEEKYLQAYLSPNISKEEKEKIDANRKLRFEQSLAESMVGMEEFQAKHAGAGDDSKSDDENDDSKDDENQEDSNFTNDIEKIINYSDMDQSFKGENINFVG